MAERTEYTISHTGQVLGHDMVTRSENATGSESAVLAFECPRKFNTIEYRGERDPTRFVPRTEQSITGTVNDDTVVSLNNAIQPVAGEAEIAEQNYPVVIAYNVDQATEVDIASVSYATNEVTLATDPADTETVKLWPILAEGEVKFQGRDSLGQIEGPVYGWTMPIYRWHDMPQDKRGYEVNLHGSVRWSRYETVEVILESDHTLVWSDPDYPRGQYVSTFEQDVVIEH